MTERLEGMTIQRRDVLIADVLRFLLERGYTITAPAADASLRATRDSATTRAETCWRSECRTGCYYAPHCATRPAQDPSDG